MAFLQHAQPQQLFFLAWISHGHAGLIIPGLLLRSRLHCLSLCVYCTVHNYTRKKIFASAFSANTRVTICHTAHTRTHTPVGPRASPRSARRFTATVASAHTARGVCAVASDHACSHVYHDACARSAPGWGPGPCLQLRGRVESQVGVAVTP